jgi:hypothetical protein
MPSTKPPAAAELGPLYELAREVTGLRAELASFRESLVGLVAAVQGDRDSLQTRTQILELRAEDHGKWIDGQKALQLRLALATLGGLLGFLSTSGLLLVKLCGGKFP